MTRIALAKSPARRLLIAATAAAAGAAFALSGAGSAGSAGSVGYPVVQPFAQDSVQVAAGVLPPTQAACNAVGRRCFTPASMQNSYDVTPLLSGGNDGHGKTIAIIDSFGYDTVAGDLENFSQQFGLPLMCGMPNVTCTPGMPTFQWDQWDGKRPIKQPPSGSHGTAQQASNAWAEEVALDTQWAHATAPGANIILMSTSVAETQGVQGLPQMMNAEQYLVDNHLADVVSQSFSTAEPDFHGGNSIQNLRHAFISGTAAGVTFLSSSGDSGTENNAKTPIKNPAALDTPSVGWPASDPLVTAVGGTYLCTDGATGTTVDSTSPGGLCSKYPGQRDVGWTDSGGGYSSIFARPSYQDTLPAGSTPIGAMRGVPDIAYQASAGTGVLIYDTAPGDNGGSDVNDGSWYVIGGTSSSCPQWAGLVAIADQLAGHDLGLIQPKLYSLASGTDHGTYFFDVTTGNNTVSSTVPGYPATAGWDPVTGLGTPDAAKLLPVLGE
ncbi:subtilase family serine protease [Catenulispora sp. MAP5-51]|uniref:S53 family peptidase n=1 Tax=Catenulispora sp. MAP5-51 TaxID=3156298 RepID=UPI0035174C00